MAEGGDIRIPASPGATCPRCGEPLPDGTSWEELRASTSRLPAYRVRHKRSAGTCIGYTGPVHRGDDAEGRAKAKTAANADPLTAAALIFAVAQPLAL